MADGRNRLKKIAFKIGEKTFKFAINPENYIYRRPHRTTAVKTKSRIVIEDFQDDIPTIYIRGTTGFDPTGRKEDRGIEKIKEMKKYLEWYTSMGGNGDTPAEDLYFYNYTNDEYFVVHIAADGVTYTQDVQSPLTYKYEIMLTVLRKAGEPSQDDIVDPEIGNKTPSIPVFGPGGPLSPYPTHIDENRPYIPPKIPNNDVYVVDNSGSEPINPQAPSTLSYTAGSSSLGYTVGYYRRDYKL